MDKKKKILIIDDDPKLRKTLSDILLLEGYAPSTAVSGKAALEKIKRDAPALVLLDLRLEDMDGLKSLKEIKKLSPDIECIVITGYVSQESAIAAVNLGAYGYIHKPYDVKQLLVFIRRAIEKKKAEEELRESELQYRILGETILYGVWLTDALGYCTSVSDSFLELVDMTMQQVQKFGWLNLLPPEDIEPTKEHWLHCVQTGENFEREHRFRTKDGSYRNVLAIGRPVRNDTGEIIKWVGLNLDITERKRAEKALRESEEKYRSLVESYVDPIYLIDKQYKYLFMNKAHLKRFNLPMDQVLGREYGDFHSKKETVRFKSEVDKVIKRGRFLKHEYQSERDGRYFLRTFNPVRGAKGQIIHVTVVSKDISIQKKAEESIKESEKKYREIVNFSPNGLVKISMKGVILECNQSFLTLSGLSKDQVINKHFTKLSTLRKKDIPRYIKIFTSILIGKFRGPFEFIWVRRDGAIRTGEAHFRILRHAGGGESVLLNLSDITERKQLEERTKESEKQYRDLVEKAGIAILIDDQEGNLRYCNSKLAKTFGYSVQEMKKLSLGSTVHPVDVEKVMKFHRNRVQGKHAPSRYEFKGVKKDGSTVYVEVDAQVLKENGNCTGSRSYMWDITERKKAEEERARLQVRLIQSEKMAGIGTLTSGIAHEFNNLLQIMSGNVQLAQRTKRPEDMAEALDIVSDISDRTTKIIRDLLAFSRQETPGKEPCDVTGVIESVLSLTEGQLRKNNIEVVRGYEETSELRVNKGELQQVFLNMVTNARDAMMPSGGILKIDVRERDGNVEVRFGDTGEGIEERDLGRVFEPFYTTKGAVGGSTAVLGTGLGLSVSYGIAKRHGGDIEVESRKGEGAAFTVKLPVYRPDNLRKKN